ncbi:hypothetical protein GLP26_03740 [Photobacterium carnosum]|uniref:hypothetical protein n=1 Tax=Photobacterium carnosum TaxID=2023717 RepID=UPI001F30C078|nr:hypothetical protein [Photobacterium carnosum]MCF2304913.1 hypothetical protein [Photobacterium carnosum]
MSLEQQIGALVKASENLTGAVNGKIGEIDKEVVAAKTKFEQFMSDADDHYMMRKPQRFSIGGELDKFYPVYFPTSSTGMARLQINRQIHADGNWKGAMLCELMCQSLGYGGLAGILQTEVLKHRTRGGDSTAQAIVKDGFLGKLFLPPYIASGIIVWLRGNTSYDVNCTLLRYVSFEQYDQLVVDSNVLLSRNSVAVMMSGCNVNHSDYTVTTNTIDTRDLTTVPSIDFIRGVA